MAHWSADAWSLVVLGAIAAPLLFACSGSASDAGRGAGDASSAGGAAGQQPRPEAGPASNSGGGLTTGSGGAAACNANRAPGIPINAGTLSASIDGQTSSGSATILWAAGANTLSLDANDGSTLTVVFPGCEAKVFSLPAAGTAKDPISMTYTSGGGEPQWACTYEDASPGPASCTIEVTAYGEQRNAPVTGTFSGVMRLTSGTGAGSKTVSAGTFTFGRP